MAIKFGSDGFRGVIGADFTADAVTRITLAAADWAAEHGAETIPIGYDTRFLNRRCAERTASIFQTRGLHPLLVAEHCPSPYLAFAAHRLGVPLALQITASHNPYFYNGVKLKAGYGGSLDEQNVRWIEQRANELELPRIPATHVAGVLDLRAEYAEALGELAGSAGCRLVVDYMHGATYPLYHDVLRCNHALTATLRTNVDPLFGGSKPEPLEPLLVGLRDAVLWDRGTVGLAFDGDGDRLAVVDETGQFLQSYEIFALLLEQLMREGRFGQRVVTTVSFSGLLGRIAASHGLEVTEVPVGFKHVAAELLKGDVLIGGEESGGAALGHYLPERDALLMALTLLKAKSDTGVTLRELLDDVYSRFGKPAYARLDVQLGAAEHARLRDRLGSLLELGSVAGESVTGSSDSDGMKLHTAAGWVLVRASGTEPLARFYAEAESDQQAQAYIVTVRKQLLANV